MTFLHRFLLLGLALFHGWLAAGELPDRLQSGHHVLLMRHAYAPGIGDPAGFSLERCETQRLLDDEGRRDATRIGQWLRDQGVARAEVYTSPWCRCRETAQLLGLGAVTVEPSLGSFFGRAGQADGQNAALQAFIARKLREKKGAALVLVTHQVNIQAFTGQSVAPGGMVLARVDARGRMVEYRNLAGP